MTSCTPIRQRKLGGESFSSTTPGHRAWSKCERPCAWVLTTCLAIAFVFGGRADADEPGKTDEPLVTEGVVKAPVSEIWKVFSTSEGFKKLGVAQCELDLRVGGVIRSHYDPKGTLGDEGTIHNEILSYERDRMISMRIKKPPQGFPFAEKTWQGTWSVISLSDLGDGRTHVRMVGLGYPESDEGRKMRQFFESGNAWVLAQLQKQFDATAPAPTGPAHVANPLAPIVLERVIELPRGEVWKLVSTSEGWRQFMGVEARVELRPAGKFELYFNSQAPEGERGSEGCTVLSFVPNQMLSFTWNAPPKFEHARAQRTWVVMHLDELTPTRTRLRIDHLGFAEQAADHADHHAEWADVRAYFQQAWNKVLDAARAKGASR